MTSVEVDGYSLSCVGQCCRGKRGIHKNRVWMYKKDYLKHGFRHKKAINHAKEIEQVDAQGAVVRRLFTAQAFAEFGFDPSNIQQVCTGAKKSHQGFIFRYISK